jgi:hypothetical protein
MDNSIVYYLCIGNEHPCRSREAFLGTYWLLIHADCKTRGPGYLFAMTELKLQALQESWLMCCGI